MPKSYAQYIEEMEEQRRQRKSRVASSGHVFFGMQTSTLHGRLNTSRLGDANDEAPTFPSYGANHTRKA